MQIAPFYFFDKTQTGLYYQYYYYYYTTRSMLHLQSITLFNFHIWCRLHQTPLQFTRSEPHTNFPEMDLRPLFWKFNSSSLTSANSHRKQVENKSLNTAKM